MAGVLAPPNIPGLDSLSPSAEEDAQWGITPAQPQQPQAPQMAIPGATANATAQAQATPYGGGQIAPSGAYAGFAAPQPQLPNQLNPALTQPGPSLGQAFTNAPAALLGAYQAGQQATDIPFLHRVQDIVSQAPLSLSGPGVMVPKGGPGGTQNFPSPGEIYASQIPTNALDVAINAAPFIPEAARGLRGAAEAVSPLARGVAENPFLRRIALEETGAIGPFERRPYMDENGNLFSADGKPMGREYPWSESNPQGFGKPAETPVPAPAPATPPVGAAAPTPEAPAGVAPQSDLERQLQASLEGKRPAPQAPVTVGEMRAVLDANGLNSGGTPSQVISRYKGLQARGVGGVGTPTENVSNAARKAYQDVLEQTGDPEQARVAAAKAARIEKGVNENASLLKTLTENAREAARRINQDETGGTTVEAMQGIGRGIASLPGEAIGLKSTLSPPALRQGKVRLVTAPMAWWRELKTSLRAFKSESVARAIREEAIADDWVRANSAEDIAAVKAGQRGLLGGSDKAGMTWQDTGGRIPDWGPDAAVDTRLEDRLVQGNTALGNKIRGSIYIKPFDRQAAIEVMGHRLNWYKSVADNWYAAGERDPAHYKALREFIEGATHRGAVPDVLRKMPIFFSAPAQAGRARFLWDLAYNVPKGLATGRVFRPGIEQEATKALVGMVTANVAQMAALSALVGGGIQMKGGLPTWKMGPFHLDPWAGWNTQAKLIYGIGKDLANEPEWAKLYGTKNVPQDLIRRGVDRVATFAEKGLSPVYSTIVASKKGTDFKGAPYNLADEATSGRLAAAWGLPFNVEEGAAAYKAGGPLGLAADIVPSTLSEGVSTYTTDTEAKDKEAQSRGYDTYAAIKDAAVKQEINDKLGIERKAADIKQAPDVASADAALRDVRDKYPFIEYKGLYRNLNESQQSRQAWNDSKTILDNYYGNHLSNFGVTPQAVAASGWKPPARKSGKETETDQEYQDRKDASELAAARKLAQKNNPQLDAWLNWWSKGQQDVATQAANDIVDQIIAKYGK